MISEEIYARSKPMYNRTNFETNGLPYNSTVRSTRKYYHFVSDFQFNSRIVVENCVVGICNNGMFLEFHEFETKYLAGVYKRH